MVRYTWIIGICNTRADGVRLVRFYGSKDEVKEQLLFLINEDRSEDTDNWEHGCESVDDIETEDNGLGYELYGYGCYNNYHIDYTAKEISSIRTLENTVMTRH